MYPFQVQPRPRTLGERLAALRVERGLSLSQAADAIGHSTDFLGHIESGNDTPSRTVIDQLARLYGCRTDDLLDG